MKIILRTIDKELKEFVKKELEKRGILNYTDDSLFDNIIYIYDVTDVLIMNDNYIIESNFNQCSIDKEIISYMSIKNED